ncbi:unknown [Prevotella sp. CAG:487]|nr:unknown [Prevotella sp. CAG:487]
MTTAAALPDGTGKPVPAHADAVIDNIYKVYKITV